MAKKANGKKGKSIRSLADLHVDPMNARVHGERNIGMISKSLEQYGAGRSILISEDGGIIAGHGVVESAAEVGITKVIPVEASGNEIIAVIRRGLTLQQKQALAVADNRTGELSEWDPEVLRALGKDIDLDQFFTKDELAKLLSMKDAPADFQEVDESLETAHVCPKCGYKFSGGEKVLKDKKGSDGGAK